MLFGCDYSGNSDAICKNNPEICTDLHHDSWCFYEKGDLIRQRYELKHTPSPTGKQVYRQLTLLEDYNHCIELAAGVKHIIHKERTNDRARAFGLSSQSLARLQESIQNSQDPYLAYYRWSRFNDQAALNLLLTAQAESKITDPQLLAPMAAYYLKSDPAKAKALYLEIFSIASPSEFDPDWLLGLASLYRQQQDLEKTYLLSKANVLMSKQKVSQPQMLALLNGNKELAQMLDQEAQQLVDSIGSGDFKHSRFLTLLAKD
ncbi:DUF2989 domain-containing protein [Shewanella salipaludis]|uniref:DUF2989 domain-containing protein n=1 Tax=Shewanella salipaludis TaxID=2723052 RepID=A0A972FVB1_9GAMM|nr:DUF2989 domain-containing protein [Shewanella salipaludis]NMH63928.1 DUF2989 domain-containing protein [Shewanella salipaludis]